MLLRQSNCPKGDRRRWRQPSRWLLIPAKPLRCQRRSVRERLSLWRRRQCWLGSSRARPPPHCPVVAGGGLFLARRITSLANSKAIPELGPRQDRPGSRPGDWRRLAATSEWRGGAPPLASRFKAGQ